MTWHLAHETDLMPLYDALVHALVDLPRNSTLIGQDWTDVQRAYPNQFRGRPGNRVFPRQQQPAVVEVQASTPPAGTQQRGVAQGRIEPAKDLVEQAKEERRKRFENVRELGRMREDVDCVLIDG